MGAEIRELMSGQERSGRRSQGRSCPTQGCRPNVKGKTETRTRTRTRTTTTTTTTTG